MEMENFSFGGMRGRVYRRGDYRLALIKSWHRFRHDLLHFFWSLVVQEDMVENWKLIDQKYAILECAYVLLTVLAAFRISRQPYNSSVKTDQLETIFKATTLTAVIVGIGISGKLNRRRSSS